MKIRYIIILLLCAASSVGLSAQRPIYSEFSNRPNLTVADLYNVSMGEYRETVTLIKAHDFYSFVALCHEFSLYVNTNSTRYENKQQYSLELCVRDKKDPRRKLPGKTDEPSERKYWHKRCVVGCSFSERTIYIFSSIRSREEYAVVGRYILDKLREAANKSE